MVFKKIELIQQIRQRQHTSHSRKKSYADRRRSELAFLVEDMVLLKVSPWNGVIFFRKWGKLGPRFIGLFQVIARVGTVTYRLDILDELIKFHSTFHVTRFWKCLVDDSVMVPLEDKI